MADETKRVKPTLLQKDRNAFSALQAISNYAPANQAYTVEAITQAHSDLQSAQTAEAQAVAALDAARDNAVAREWEFHNLMLGVKDQVTAQFGRNSNEVQSLGRKKASERKPPKRKVKNKESK
jgi:hypothetical protein